MSVFARLVAFTCLVFAAFAWVPPLIDRAGLAALGLAFAVLGVPARRGQTAPPPAQDEPELAVPVGIDLHAEVAEMLSRLGAHSAPTGGSGT